MNVSKMSLWGLLKNSSGWDKLSNKQRLIVIWWCLSLVFMCIEGPIWIMALSVLNFGVSTVSLIKYVPEPKDED